MEVEVRKVGAAQGGYGLVYGMTDNLSEFYVFLVWPDYHESCCTIVGVAADVQQLGHFFLTPVPSDLPAV